MNLGTKNANNLISKDYKTAKEAALNIVQNSDIETFIALCEKSDFIFDFIKEKILKNLITAVTKENVLNLFNFTKIYSFDFKDFITDSFARFSNPEIENKMLDILNNGSDCEKTYALDYFSKIENKNTLAFAKKLINSEFDPLKSAAINILYKFNSREEYNFAIETLRSNSSDFEKIEAADFLAKYGDKEAFYSIYDYFKNSSGQNEIIAQYLLDLKSFKELIRKNNEEAILKISCSILRSFPDILTFDDINFYIDDEVLDFLMESGENKACLIIFYLKHKIDLILNNDAYLIDLTNNNKQDAALLQNKLEEMTYAFNKKDVYLEALTKGDKTEILMAIETSNEEFIDDIKNVLKTTNETEIIISCLEFLKQAQAISSDIIFQAEQKVQNENIKAQIKSFY